MSYNWILVQIKNLLKQLKEVRLEVLILETLILVLLESGKENIERISSVEKH